MFPVARADAAPSFPLMPLRDALQTCALAVLAACDSNVPSREICEQALGNAIAHQAIYLAQVRENTPGFQPACFATLETERSTACRPVLEAVWRAHRGERRTTRGEPFLCGGEVAYTQGERCGCVAGGRRPDELDRACAGAPPGRA